MPDLPLRTRGPRTRSVRRAAAIALGCAACTRGGNLHIMPVAAR